MRLTLRTLLSWLDDTLPAAEVRAIGQQVNESPYARDLVERIRKVTRQRRLSIPPASGPDAADPNLVADYLDNTLAAEKVAEYERICLKSDVHLAEVASSHQILSLLGQRAKVPPDARYRMYHLVKGREALGERARRSAAPVKPEPVAAEVPTWRPEPAASRDANSRLIPIAVSLAALVLAWSTWDNLQPRPDSERADLIAAAETWPAPAQPDPAAPAPGPGAPPAAPGAQIGLPLPQPANEVPARLAENRNAPAAEAPAPGVATAVEPDQPAEPEPEPAPPRAPAAAILATVDPEPGLLLTRAEGGGAWRRLLAGATLKPGEAAFSLEPFRSSLRIASLTLHLVDATHLSFLEPAGDATPILSLEEGRLIARSDAPTATLLIALGESRIPLGLPAGVPVGLERIREWRPGQARSPEPGLILYLPEGDLTVQAADHQETVRGPMRLAFSPTGELRERLAEPPPAWVIDPSPPVDRDEAARQLLRFFKPDKPPVTSLVEAIASESEGIRRLAFRALSVLGQFPLLIDALHTPRQPETRRAAIDALRQALARDETVTNRLAQDLKRANRDESWGTLAESLLRGYGVEDLADDAIRSLLLAALEHPDVAIRELALDNLMRLTRRGDSMGYDPDDPTARGIKAWRDQFPSRARSR